ncbi:MAG TPA: hypothetical protein VF557_09015 [Jatrophihabitans sp.]|jgi:hypothetical protein|uniref:HAAS signaling domain-containing protein n=1 Tax=Jatrophihabitans sp. TaxID=1932789 RepID=UPI002EFF087C
MSIPVTDPFLRAYLDRLDRCAAVLPTDQRTELVEEISRHIADAMAIGQVRTEADMRTMLDRLGEPEEIVAAARADAGATPGFTLSPPYIGEAPVALRAPTTTWEGITVALLTIGSIVPVIGWLAGVAMLWTSTRWRPGEKVLGTLIMPLGPAAVIWFALIPVSSESCTGGTETPSFDGTVTTVPQVCTHSGLILSAWMSTPLILFWLIAPIAVAVVLFKRAAARAAKEPPVPITIEQLDAARWGGLEIAAVLLLSVGTFVAPIIAPIAGLALAWTSDAWTRTEKVVATALTLGAVLLGLFAFFFLFFLMVA